MLKGRSVRETASVNVKRVYWFKAKKSGLGWSTPLTWQGWLVHILMFGGILFSWFTGKDVGQKLIGTWVALPIFWVFGEPLSARKPTDRS